MPSRYLVPLTGIDPARTTREQLHAVAGTWFDDIPGDQDRAPHRGASKPWSMTPLRAVGSVIVAECSTLTELAEQRLLERVRPGRNARFGGQIGRVLAAPEKITGSTWQQLAVSSGHRTWSLHLLTPTTFRNGNRCSPWPDPFTVLRSLSTRWTATHTADHPEPSHLELPTWPPARLATVWVSDVDGASEMFRLADLTISGFVGHIRYICDDAEVAGTVDTLLRFAEYAGVGSYTPRGLGVARLDPAWPPSHKPRKPHPSIQTSATPADAHDSTSDSAAAGDRHG